MEHTGFDRQGGLLLDLATDEDLPGHTSVWANHITEPEHYSVRLRKDPGEDELSTAEVQLLDEVFQLHDGCGRGRSLCAGARTNIKNADGSKTPLGIATVEAAHILRHCRPRRRKPANPLPRSLLKRGGKPARN